MKKKRELFTDFINGLYNIEYQLFKNNLPGLHETEESLFKFVDKQKTEKGTFSKEPKGIDKRIKNRLKNKILETLEEYSIEKYDRNLKGMIGEEVSFKNAAEVKKNLRRALKQPLLMQNIHTVILLLDELRSFYIRFKEKNEALSYFEMLEENQEYLDFNLGVSYFLRRLDVEMKDTSDLSFVDNNVAQIRNFIAHKHIIGGYKFQLSTLLVQHWINVGEWEEAMKVALQLKGNMENGMMYSKNNLMKLMVILATISNQMFDKEGYNYYKSEIEKGGEEDELIESELIDIKTIMTIEEAEISKNMLERVESIATKIESEKINLYLRLLRTEAAIRDKDYISAKRFNDVFFIDIHNKQVREYLDKIYIHRFVILYNLGKYEELVKLFESKVTQKRILNLERKGRQLIYPYVYYDLARQKEEIITKEEAFNNIYRILDYYQFNNYFECYKRIGNCIEVLQQNLNINDKQKIMLGRMKNLISDTLSKIG